LIGLNKAQRQQNRQIPKIKEIVLWIQSQVKNLKKEDYPRRVLLMICQVLCSEMNY